jgi:hypothetical protein
MQDLKVATVVVVAAPLLTILEGAVPVLDKMVLHHLTHLLLEVPGATVFK